MFAIGWSIAVAAHVIEGARFEPQEGRGFGYRQVGGPVSSDVIATHGIEDLGIQVEENGDICGRQKGNLLILRHDTPCMRRRARMMRDTRSAWQWRVHIFRKCHGSM
jgi:hypothetical protein